MKTKAAGKQKPAPLYPTSFILCGIFVVGVESKNMPRPLATPPSHSMFFRFRANSPTESKLICLARGPQ